MARDDPHVSVGRLLGGCWGQTYFEERPIFGRKDLFLGARAITSKKATCGKGRKSSMQEENPCVRR